MTIFGQKMVKNDPKNLKKPKIQRKRTDTIIAGMFLDLLKLYTGLGRFRDFQGFGISWKITEIGQFTYGPPFVKKKIDFFFDFLLFAPNRLESM